MLYSADSDVSEDEDASYDIRESIQDSPHQFTRFSLFFSSMKNCCCYLFVKNRNYEQDPPRGAFFGFVTPNFMNCLGALYFLRLGYVIGQNGFVYTILSLLTTIVVIVFMQVNSYILYHHRPYYERKDKTLFLILKKTFGIELTALLSFQQFMHHLLNCINNLVGLTILFSHFYLTPFFESSSNVSRLILAVSVTSFIFLVIGVGTSLLFFNIRSIFSVLSVLVIFVSFAMCVMFIVSLIFQSPDVVDGYVGWIRPGNFVRNLVSNHEYRYSLNMEVPGNMMAIMSPIIMDISFHRSFKNIKRDHVHSALFMDTTLFFFTLLVIILVSFNFIMESLLYNVIIFLEATFLPWIFCLLLTVSICYTISSYLQSMTNLVDILINYGEWKFFRKYFGFRKAVICFLIHIVIFIVYILIEYIGISLFTVSKFTALITLMFVQTTNLSMFIMLVIGRLPPKKQHISLFRKFVLGTLYCVVGIATFAKMVSLSVQLTGIVIAIQLILFLVVANFTSPYTGVLPQWFLLNQIKKVLRMSRFESRDRLKSLNIIHFVPTPKNSYPSIALFTLFNSDEGIYTIANIQNPRYYNEGEHLHRIRREREFWLAFLDEMQLNHRNLLLKFMVSHSVRRGVQGMCLTNEWKRNVASLGFPTVKKREVKLGKYGIDVFTSESLTECLRKFSTDQWHTKLRNQQEYIGILKDLLYIFQLNVIVYHRLDKLDKFVFRGEVRKKSSGNKEQHRQNDSNHEGVDDETKRRSRRRRKRRRRKKKKRWSDDSIQQEPSLDNNNNGGSENNNNSSESDPGGGGGGTPVEVGGYMYSPEEEILGYSYRRVKKKKQYFDIWLLQQDLEANSSNIFCLRMLSYINEKWFEDGVKLTFRLFYIVKSPSLIPVYEKKFEQMLIDCRVRKKVVMCIQCYSNLSHQYYYDSIPDIEKCMLYGEMLKKFSDKESAMIFCVFDPPKANEMGNEYWKKLKAIVKSVETPILLFFAPDYEDDEDSQMSDTSINM